MQDATRQPNAQTPKSMHAALHRQGAGSRLLIASAERPERDDARKTDGRGGEPFLQLANV